MREAHHGVAEDPLITGPVAVDLWLTEAKAARHPLADCDVVWA